MKVLKSKFLKKIGDPKPRRPLAGVNPESGARRAKEFARGLHRELSGAVLG